MQEIKETKKDLREMNVKVAEKETILRELKRSHKLLLKRYSQDIEAEQVPPK